MAYRCGAGATAERPGGGRVRYSRVRTMARSSLTWAACGVVPGAAATVVKPVAAGMAASA